MKHILGFSGGIDSQAAAGVLLESYDPGDVILQEWDDFFDCWLNHIIAAWPNQRCFDFVQARGERVNELYRMGFNRVGCAPCALCAKEDIANWAIRRPANIDKIRTWEQQSGVTFFQPIRQGPAKSINGVDEVVNWALNPKRGGSRDQPLFPILMELPPGQPMPLISGLPRAYSIEITSQGWVHNTEPKGITK